MQLFNCLLEVETELLYSLFALHPIFCKHSIVKSDILSTFLGRQKDRNEWIDRTYFKLYHVFCYWNQLNV
jgi:hypothetical protein